MENVCRVCMSNAVTLVDLFAKQTEQTEEHSLAEMLTECVNCEVQLNDPLPNKICLTCVIDTKNAFRFKRKCEKSHIHFWQMFNIENNEDQSSSADEQHEWNFEEVDCIKALARGGGGAVGVGGAAEETAIGIDEWELNWQEQAESKPKAIDCLQPSGANLITEIRKEIQKFEPEVNIQTADATPTGQAHLCDICGKALSNPTVLKEHILIHSTEHRPYICPYCSKGFNQRSHLRAHTRVHTGERPYECTVCCKMFVHNHHLRDHMMAHTGERPYQCPHCPKNFNRNANLQTHLVVHSGKRPFICPICDATFNHPSNLEKHSRIHSGKRPYLCTLCPKTFTRRQHLNDHALVHTNDRPYHCDACTRDFRSRPGLKKHICEKTEPLQVSRRRKPKFNAIANLHKGIKKEVIAETEVEAKTEAIPTENVTSVAAKVEQ